MFTMECGYNLTTSLYPSSNAEYSGTWLQLKTTRVALEQDGVIKELTANYTPAELRLLKAAIEWRLDQIEQEG